MKNTPVDAFELTIDRIDVTTEGDEIWLPEIVREMADAGFSMKGGVYVKLTLRHPTIEDLMTSSYVPVARRTKPNEREPENFDEAGRPEFMNYCCFLSGPAYDWGARVVNSIIAANYGRMPDDWLTSGMSELDTPVGVH